MKIGLKEIAEKANVSVMAVSCALNGTGKISKKRREEIQNIAREMGYYPSIAAQLLKQKENDSLGLVLFEHEEVIRQNAGSMDMIIQFTRVCNQLGISNHIEWLDTTKYPNEVPKLLTNGLVGGVLIAGKCSGESQKYIEKYLKLPYVTITEPGPNSVYYEISSVIKETFEYAYSIGHRKIGMINGDHLITIYKITRDAFFEKKSELSLDNYDFYYEIPPFRIANNNGDSDIKYIYQKYISLPLDERPTLLFSANGLFTKALIAGFTKFGVKIPEELSVICYGTLDWEAEKFFPSITAIEYSYNDIIEPAIDMIRKMLKNQTVEHNNILVNPRFTARETLIRLINEN